MNSIHVTGLSVNRTTSAPISVLCYLLIGDESWTLANTHCYYSIHYETYKIEGLASI